MYTICHVVWKPQEIQSCVICVKCNWSNTHLIFLGAFVICWTPGLVILLLDGLSCTGCQVLKYEKYCLVLAECNSLVNPIIYSCRDEDMRNTFKRILCFLCRQEEEQDGELGNVQSDTLKTERLLSEKFSTIYNHTERNHTLWEPGPSISVRLWDLQCSCSVSHMKFTDWHQGWA